MNYEVVNSLQEAANQCERLIKKCESNKEYIEESLGGELMNLYLQGNEAIISELRTKKRQIQELLNSEKEEKTM